MSPSPSFAGWAPAAFRFFSSLLGPSVANNHILYLSKDTSARLPRSDLHLKDTVLTLGIVFWSDQWRVPERHGP
jgi:hypothetical protein